MCDAAVPASSIETAMKILRLPGTASVFLPGSSSPLRMERGLAPHDSMWREKAGLKKILPCGTSLAITCARLATT
jgi:hypothetical protein